MMMTMTVDLYSAQYQCTSHAHGAVVLSQRHSRKKKSSTETENKFVLNLDAGDVGLSTQRAEKSPGRVFRCLRKTVESHNLAGCGRAFQSLGAELDTALQPSIRHSVSSVINT